VSAPVCRPSDAEHATLLARAGAVVNMKVLLGIGGSEDSMRALDVTVARAREVGDDLTVAVLDNPAADRSVEAVEARVRDRLADAGLDAEVRVLEGDPGSRLVEVAEAEGFDRIVLGGGETSPLGKVTIGSIAEFVVLNSPTTVTLVR
jgi:nucleotide-binding universal stress UspA family protein